VQVARTLKAKFPEVEVIGSVYPPGAMKSFIAQICSLVFLLGLVTMIAGKFFGDSLRIPVLSELAKKMNENQMQSIMIIFMANIIGGQMLSTGAFEIYLEEDLVFSKLQTGGLPQLDQIADIVGKIIQSQ